MDICLQVVVNNINVITKYLRNVSNRYLLDVGRLNFLSYFDH
jgi:hypothetical protein